MKRAIHILNNATTIKTSNIRPYKLLDLYDENILESKKICDALSTASELSTINLPKINKSITVFIDTSDIAQRVNTSSVSKMAPCYRFASLAAIFTRMFDTVDVYTFDESVNKKTIDINGSLVDISSSMIDINVKKRANEEIVFNFLDSSAINSDILIFFSADKLWESVLRNSPIPEYLTHYMNRASTSQQLIFITLQNNNITYTHSLRNTDFINGLNDKNLSYLFYLLQVDSKKIDDII